MVVIYRNCHYRLRPVIFFAFLGITLIVSCYGEERDNTVISGLRGESFINNDEQGDKNPKYYALRSRKLNTFSFNLGDALNQLSSVFTTPTDEEDETNNNGNGGWNTITNTNTNNIINNNNIIDTSNIVSQATEIVNNVVSTVNTTNIVDQATEIVNNVVSTVNTTNIVDQATEIVNNVVDSTNDNQGITDNNDESDPASNFVTQIGNTFGLSNKEEEEGDDDDDLLTTVFNAVTDIATALLSIFAPVDETGTTTTTNNSDAATNFVTEIAANFTAQADLIVDVIEAEIRRNCLEILNFIETQNTVDAIDPLAQMVVDPWLQQGNNNNGNNNGNTILGLVPAVDENSISQVVQNGAGVLATQVLEPVLSSSQNNNNNNFAEVVQTSTNNVLKNEANAVTNIVGPNLSDVGVTTTSITELIETGIVSLRELCNGSSQEEEEETIGTTTTTATTSTTATTTEEEGTSPVQVEVEEETTTTTTTTASATAPMNP